MSCSENTDSTDCDWDFSITQENEIARLRAELDEAEHKNAIMYKALIRIIGSLDSDADSIGAEDIARAAIDAATEREEER